MATSIDSPPREPTTPDPARDDSVMHRLTVRAGGLSRPIAGTRWFRLWAVLRHVGRRSGTTYETPIVALPAAGGFLIPLPFGDATQWLKNLRSADQAGLRYGGREFVIDHPELVDRETAGPDLPGWVRFAARRVGIEHFVRVRQVSRA
jgi:deazaflavin-dependent oxidoreductase (nitroreductase family)